MPRELVQASGHDRSRSLGLLALAWLDHFAVHGPGDVQGRPLDPTVVDGLPLDEEWQALIVDHYALDGSGRRLYDSAFTSRAKGRAKSELAAFEVLWEAFGACRFAGWARGGEVYRFRDFVYEYEPGEPMGRPVVYPFIRCLATEEGQAGNTYDNVYFNLTDGPLGEDLPSNAAGLTRTLLPHGGEIVPSTASNSSKDGGKETHVVFDETHLYTLPELRRMYATVRRNMAKRRDAEPWSHETSTMYLPGEGSVAQDTHALAKAIAAGTTKRSRLFFDHREGFADVDLADERSLLASLREVYGPFAEVMDLRRIVDEIWDPRNDPSDSRRYYLNQPTSSTDAWVAHHEWKTRLDVDKVLADGDVVVLGFDGSRGRNRGVADATALVGCRVSDGHLFTVRVWEQPDGPGAKDWAPSDVEVDAAVRTAFDRFSVVGFYADPSGWVSQVAGWEAAYGRRLKVKASPGAPVTAWPRGKDSRVTEWVKRTHDAIVNGELTHDGSDALTRHVLNARRRQTRHGYLLYKENPDSRRKVDAAYAAVMAWKARTDAVAAGLGRHASRSSRKIVVLS